LTGNISASISAGDLADLAKAIADILTTLAILLGGLYFFHRYRTGFFTVNAKLSLELERQEQADQGGSDILVMKVLFERGDLGGAVSLQDAKAKLSWDGESTTVDLQLPLRWSFRKEGRRRLLTPDRTSEKSPYIRLTPGDSMAFAAWSSVPSGRVVRVEVALDGVTQKRPMGSKTGSQWRGSGVSLPLTTEV
jgi:hypothetical protein